jgi:Flp pilus assembly protein TadB
MDEAPLDLTSIEKLLLERSEDPGLTRRRLRMVVISGLLLAAALIVLSPLVGSWELLLFFAVAYVLVTTWERVGYARTIIAYKRLIRKLADRIQTLESDRASNPPLP